MFYQLSDIRCLPFTAPFPKRQAPVSQLNKELERQSEPAEQTSEHDVVIVVCVADENFDDSTKER